MEKERKELRDPLRTGTAWAVLDWAVGYGGGGEAVAARDSEGDIRGRERREEGIIMAMAMEAMGEEEWEDLGRQAEPLESGREGGSWPALWGGGWAIATASS